MPSEPRNAAGSTTAKASGAWATTGQQPRIAVIGAGMSGVAAAIMLEKAGYNNVVVYEKADRVGGTWRENRYPGLSCDVVSYWYQYTFAPNPDWTHRFSYGPEIQAYIEKVAIDFDVNAKTRFNCGVQEIRYQKSQWLLITEHGEEEIYDVVISATGILHHPKLPDIPGLASFTGNAFHSAQWNSEADIDGARVGIIGTGSTSAQLAGALAEKTGHLTVFQRTPQWTFPFWQRTHPTWWKALLRRAPSIHRWLYKLNAIIAALTFGPATLRKGFMRSLLQWMCERHLQQSVPNAELREKLTPNYQAGCKRLVLNSSFYAAVNRDNVTLETEAIERIEPKGVVTRDGKLHSVDTLVLCTGFQTNKFILPTRVLGRDGVSLADVWGEAPRAHRAVAVPEFPNLWFLEGPTAPVGNISLFEISETQVKYIIQCLDHMKANGLSAISADPKACADYNATMVNAASKTVWASGGCNSWYIDASGIPNLYAHSAKVFHRDMRKPDFSEYQLKRAET